LTGPGVVSPPTSPERERERERKREERAIEEQEKEDYRLEFFGVETHPYNLGTLTPITITYQVSTESATTFLTPHNNNLIYLGYHIDISLPPLPTPGTSLLSPTDER